MIRCDTVADPRLLFYLYHSSSTHFKSIPKPNVDLQSEESSFQVNDYLNIEDINPQARFEIYPVEVIARAMG